MSAETKLNSKNHKAPTNSFGCINTPGSFFLSQIFTDPNYPGEKLNMDDEMENQIKELLGKGKIYDQLEKEKLTLNILLFHIATIKSFKESNNDKKVFEDKRLAYYNKFLSILNNFNFYTNDAPQLVENIKKECNVDN